MFEIVNLEHRHLDGLMEVEEQSFIKPWSRVSFEEELANSKARYFAAICDGRVSGYAGLWHVIDEGHITNIAVLPEKRRNGIGKALLESLISYAETEKLVFLTLEVRVSNEAAIALYKKYGFEEIGRRKNYYEGREDALLLRRDSHEYTGD